MQLNSFIIRENHFSSFFSFFLWHIPLSFNFIFRLFGCFKDISYILIECAIIIRTYSDVIIFLILYVLFMCYSLSACTTAAFLTNFTLKLHQLKGFRCATILVLVSHKHNFNYVYTDPVLILTYSDI